MESHLDRVDRSLEELTKKVQKHTLKTPDIINPTSDKTDKTSKTWFFNGKCY